ncbi:hypothetical protein BLNAU_7575 [Blattamonas nauphoetae]|uniref:FYVE-type domain-containing protein n=1 Tax=Blattamonas nauphoetae TaxID=2049346 RepID=A0ABQ9Y116_9EUKA|nr:hypothetical protein BLNAU_7575 [Blattamonas nauphoetae]
MSLLTPPVLPKGFTGKSTTTTSCIVYTSSNSSTCFQESSSGYIYNRTVYALPNCMNTDKSIRPAKLTLHKGQYTLDEQDCNFSFLKSKTLIPSASFNEEFVLYVGASEENPSIVKQWVVSLETLKANELPFYTSLSVQLGQLLPSVGHRLCSLRDGQLILLFGGITQFPESIVSNRTFTFDCANMEWSCIDTSKSPSPRFDHSLCNWGQSRAILFGGQTNRRDGDCLNELWIYNSNLITWTQIFSTGSISAPFRKNHASLVVNHCFFVYGGYDQRNGLCCTLWRFDLQSLVWAQITFTGGPPPPPLFNPGFLSFAYTAPSQQNSELEATQTDIVADRSDVISQVQALLIFGSKEDGPSSTICAFDLPMTSLPDSLNSTPQSSLHFTLEDSMTDPETVPFIEFEETQISPDEFGLTSKTISQTGTNVSSDVAPTWVPDEATQSCRLCRTRFTLTNRRHHCRRCGYIFCGSCCYKKANIPEFNLTNVRVCTPCFEILQKKRS